MIVIIVIFSYLVVNLSSFLSAYAVTQPAETKSSQGISTRSTKNSLHLSNQYIVTMKGNASVSDIEHVIDFVKEKGGQVLQIYKHVIKGFSMSLPSVSAEEHCCLGTMKSIQKSSKVEHDVEGERRINTKCVYYKKSIEPLISFFLSEGIKSKGTDQRKLKVGVWYNY